MLDDTMSLGHSVSFCLRFRSLMGTCVFFSIVLGRLCCAVIAVDARHHHATSRAGCACCVICISKCINVYTRSLTYRVLVHMIGKKRDR